MTTNNAHALDLERVAAPPRRFRNVRRDYLAEIAALRQREDDPAVLADRRYEAALVAADEGDVE